MASNARRFAEIAYTGCSKGYLRLANQWDALASEVDATDVNWKGRSQPEDSDEREYPRVCAGQGKSV